MSIIDDLHERRAKLSPLGRVYHRVWWWADSVTSAIVGKPGPGQRLGLCVLGEVSGRVEQLEKVHSAACRHLEEQGPCDDTSDHDDEYHCGGECTYCDLNEFASAVSENTDRSEEKQSDGSTD